MRGQEVAVQHEDNGLLFNDPVTVVTLKLFCEAARRSSDGGVTIKHNLTG
jgi:hypothetical protein